MKFLIDAQLPRRLSAELRAIGFEVTHTLDLPEGNRTTDRTLTNLSIAEQLVVVTKELRFRPVISVEARALEIAVSVHREYWEQRTRHSVPPQHPPKG